MHDNKTFYIYDKTSTNYIENKDILTTKEFQKFLLDSFVIKNKKKFKFNNDNILNSNPKDFFFAINLEGKNNIIEFKNNLFITAKSLKYNKDYLKLYLLIKQDNYKKTPISSVKNNTTNNIYFNSILLLSIFIILSLTLIKKYFIKKKIYIILITGSLLIIYYYSFSFNTFLSYLYIFLSFVITLLFFDKKNIYLKILIYFFFFNLIFIIFKITLIFESINILILTFYFLYLARKKLNLNT